eukprot:SAG31_NODE_2049_length_6564_cov_13.995824_10_plen_86_part_00
MGTMLTGTLIFFVLGAQKSPPPPPRRFACGRPARAPHVRCVPLLTNGVYADAGSLFLIFAVISGAIATGLSYSMFSGDGKKNDRP